MRLTPSPESTTRGGWISSQHQHDAPFGNATVSRETLPDHTLGMAAKPVPGSAQRTDDEVRMFHVKHLVGDIAREHQAWREDLLGRRTHRADRQIKCFT